MCLACGDNRSRAPKHCAEHEETKKHKVALQQFLNSDVSTDDDGPNGFQIMAPNPVSDNDKGNEAVLAQTLPAFN